MTGSAPSPKSTTHISVVQSTGDEMTGEKSAVIVGSKTHLVSSPDGYCIQLSPEPPRTFSIDKLRVSDSTTTSPIFRSDIRQEWIDAMFGKDFLQHKGENNKFVTPPRQGLGLANIPSYFCHVVKIPQRSSASDKKAGVTLSRIPIGVYVRMVDVTSEAYAAGVVPGSVLVAINDMGVLGEPSHKLLERLWQYEGHFNGIEKHHQYVQDVQYDNKENKLNGKDADKRSNDKTRTFTGALNGPVVLKFIKDGQLYSVVFVANPPFGISWAPCGNFALVQRSYSFAEKAGLHRGCIVAAVNDKSFRDLDHLDTAMEIKHKFSDGEEINLICVYTPAASRTGFFERGPTTEGSKVTRNDNVKSLDGARVRRATKSNHEKLFHEEKPMEYGQGTFFMCGSGSTQFSSPSKADISPQDKYDIISDIANRAAAGEYPAPTGMKRDKRSKNDAFSLLGNRRSASGGNFNLAEFGKCGSHHLDTSTYYHKYCDCPSNWTDILTEWDPLDSITYCLKMRSADYTLENFNASGGVIGSVGNLGIVVLNPNNIKSTDRKYVALHSTEANIKIIQDTTRSAFAGSIFTSVLLQIVALVASSDLSDRTLSESKQDKAKAVSDTTLIWDQIMEALIFVAMKNDELCQSLHFLLRCFCASLTCKADHDTTAASSLKFLQKAHNLLKQCLLERESFRGLQNGEIYSSKLLSHKEFSTPDVIPSPIVEEHKITTRVSFEEFKSEDETKNESKGKTSKIKNFFRPKSKKDSSKMKNISSESESVTVDFSDGVDSVGNSPVRTVPKSSSKSRISLRPKSILKKMKDDEIHNARVDLRNNNSYYTCFPSRAILFENMGWFLSHLDDVCSDVQSSLLKSMSQKLADWALQPWSDSKHKALSEGTMGMRKTLEVLNEENNHDNDEKKCLPVLNPVNSSEVLTSIEPANCYILPSAHFPLLLTFNASSHGDLINEDDTPTFGRDENFEEPDMLYRVKIEFLGVKGSPKIESNTTKNEQCAFMAHASIASVIKETGCSSLEPYYGSTTYSWRNGNILEFDSVSSAGYPVTAGLHLSSVSYEAPHQTQSNDINAMNCKVSEVGFSWIDLSVMWEDAYRSHNFSSFKVIETDLFSYDNQQEFDQDGFMSTGPLLTQGNVKIEVKVSTEAIPLKQATKTSTASSLQMKRMLLYKHGEDMKQEMLAVQFVQTCDLLLKSAGLDLKIMKYKCIPVGEKVGFIEWIGETVSLSEVCKPIGSCDVDIANQGSDSKQNESADSAFMRTGGWCKFESLRALRKRNILTSKSDIGLSGDNPVQDYFRSNAYDPDAPYMIRKEVMDTYVKSCAGYTVITYLLGVGDRHTDNLLLHPKGYFLHCDYSFILGRDPKTYLPLRITEEMVNGMGGRDSDNFAKFLSYAGAAFVSLRQHGNIRMLLSLVRNLMYSDIPDISINQKPEDALGNMYKRFRLDLNDDEAVTFLEDSIEKSLASKVWIAVDAIHSLGKRF